jgi:NIPSNAP
MILERRTHAFRPDSGDRPMNENVSGGPPAQKKRLNTLLGSGVSEIDRPHTFVPIWSRDRLFDREMRREATQADPDWRKFTHDLFRRDAILPHDMMTTNPTPLSSTTEMGRA